jgi:2-polyprenyl-6-methoxyphenol hydroxylase-like FAD-dependent oxidoreductase
MTPSTMPGAELFDVAIVGCGPVGAALAILLGQRGRRVVVLERYPEPYPLPRAVHFDHEVGRILQACGIGDALARISEPAEIYEFQNAERKPFLRFGRTGTGLSGWPQSSMFSQPELEAVLFERIAVTPSVEMRRGLEVTAIEDGPDVVTLHAQPLAVDRSRSQGSQLGSVDPEHAIRARYVVGCDGANSTVRALLDVPFIDRGFFYDWLIVDLVFDEPRVFDPLNMQVCDPARPTTVVSGGPGRRRWEFMARPDESVAELDDIATAWRLLEPWDARPDNARLERHAVYRFQARWVEQWRRGRVFLAGDAAHQTPPFAGQGMGGGLRDAINLAWKLDLLLSDLAPDRLLDTYGTERAPNMETVIELAIEMGKMICVADPAEAAARDEALLALYDGSITEVPPFPGIADGVVLSGSPHAGELFLQADLAHNGTRARFDDVVGAGWRLVTIADPAEIDHDLVEWFGRIGGRIVPIDANPEVVDIDGAYRKWFADHDATTALQRPDFSLFGTSLDSGENLLGALRASPYLRA